MTEQHTEVDMVDSECHCKTCTGYVVQIEALKSLLREAAEMSNTIYRHRNLEKLGDLLGRIDCALYPR